MRSDPMIVFCTTCKGRTQHLAETLPKNLVDNVDYFRHKFVVLDYGSPDHLSEYLMVRHFGDIDSGRLVVYSFPEAEQFKMAHAKNMAHRCGLLEGADILVNLDADNFTGPNFASYVAHKFVEESLGHDVFLWANRNQPAPFRYPKGCNGRIAVSSSTFLKSGGYDQTQYNEWGPDDKDFHHRLRRLGSIAIEIHRDYLDVILHNDKMRFKEYPHVKTKAYEEEFKLVDQTTTIANVGHFGEGVVYRNCDFKRPITLGGLPTRLFGIGMHKTGTTSLHDALNILSLDSAHWKSVRWAKNIWNEMRELGRSPTLEQHYALSDLPITILFRQLDAAYPGSKFILTLRDENQWLESVRNHWGRFNNWKHTWKKEDKFTHVIHQEVYGQTDFEESVFLSRYRRHNAEVREYFKDRPEDLLVMDMSLGAGWGLLCGFLDKPIPKVPYPQSFQTTGMPTENQVVFVLGISSYSGFEEVRRTESLEEAEAWVRGHSGTPDTLRAYQRIEVQ
jgi:sulfotransferase family protein